MSTPVAEATIDAALLAVRRAAALTSAAQGRLVAGDTLTKGDDSPVTVADFGAQAVVCATLAERLGDVAVVGEEDSSDVSGHEQSTLLGGVADLASGAIGRSVDPATVLDWISLGGADAAGDRFWTLDPIDGTKGFLRGDQYAIALALIERGEVVLGVLGCPNLPNADGSAGAVFVAANGRTEMYVADRPAATDVSVADPATLAAARFCESVESGHSDQDRSAAVARLLGISAEPYRIDSQCKYGAVARGDASIYLRLPTRADYVEKIWDHAAGKLVVELAGGRVTDVHGAPLDFTCGARLSANSGVIATSGRFHDEVVAAVGSILA
jgi:3'(2'), 5'-bisphosphate nucleotidase